ncbi:MAG: hypothetical protein ABS938_09860 [Psychrobacillus psychrodurans]
MKAEELDFSKVGSRLFGAPLASLQGHHKYLKSTFDDYISVDEDDLEGEFVKDILTLSTPEIIDKWYGGTDEALTFILEAKKKSGFYDKLLK